VSLRAKRSPRWLLGSALLAGLCLARPAAAQPNAEDRASARSLAAEGYDALERKDYATAVDRFRHADALVHAPTISVDLARALVGSGKLVEASERYQLVIREGVPKGSPASWKQALEDAQKESAALEPRLAWVVIHVMGPLDPEVTIDGVRVPEGSLGARRAADPGQCEVRATAPGFEPAVEQVKLGEGEEQTVTLVLKKLPPGPKPEVESEPQPVAPVAKKEEPNRVPAWIAFGVGGAGLVVGTVTGVIALQAHSDLAEQCPNDTCTPAPEDEQQVRSDVSRYHTFGTISGIGFVVALAGAVTGTVLLVTGTPSQPSPPKAAFWPVIGPSRVGVAGRF
jgi:hypothetical protein